MAGIFLALAGCGYVGPVLPPSPQLPQAIVNLTAVQRGDQLVIIFDTPARTTDNLPVKEFSEIDLRIGAAPKPFDFDAWSEAAARYEVAVPPRGDPHNPLSFQLSKTIPAQDWIGKHVAIAVRTSTGKNDRYSSWSNRVLLDVLPRLAAPVLTAAATAKGISLTWPPPAPGLDYRIYRKAAGETAPAQLGTSNTTDFLDTAAQYDTPYEYTAVSVHGLVESLPSKPVAIKAQDIFPPSVPAGLTALAGPNTIEVSWQRSPESDLKGYFVYRSTNSGPFEAVGGLLTIPAFSDHAVEHGKTYRYQVSSVDRKNNPSAKSAAAEVSY